MKKQTVKKLTVGTLLLSVGTFGMGNVALADSSNRVKHRFTEYGNVIEVEPVFKRIRHERPQKECWIEQQEQIVTYEGSTQNFGSNQSYRGQSSSRGGDVIIGGLIGGGIGNQLGKSGSRVAINGATVAGAIIGSNSHGR